VIFLFLTEIIQWFFSRVLTIQEYFGDEEKKSQKNIQKEKKREMKRKKSENEKKSKREKYGEKIFKFF
jgi:hypothetical protein